jgi:hypothetical protein
MKRLIGLLAVIVLGAMAAGLVLAGPVLAERPTLPHTGRVLMAVGDLYVPAGDQADAVVVFNGHAEIQGRVDTIVVFDGTATVSGTTIDSLVVIRGSAIVTDSHVLGNIRTFDAQVAQTNMTLDGTARGFEADLIALGWAIGIGALLIWIGIGIATLAAGLLVAGLAGRQLRETAAIVRREPLRAVGGGLIGLIVPPILTVLLMVTVVGIPLGVGVLLFAWPLMAFVGYIVAAAWLGGWALDALRGPRPEADRPYLATVVGLVILFLAGIVPLLSGILSFLGFGAVVVAAWRTVRGVSTPTLFHPTPSPVAG